MMNTDFTQRFQDAITTEIPQLLELLTQNFNKMPSHLRGSFNQLKDEFVNQANSFRLADWRARMLVLMSNFQFEIHLEENKKNTNNNTQNTNTQMTQATKTLYIIFADMKGYSSNAGNNELLAKVKNFFNTLKAKHFADEKLHLFKALGDGILATGYNLADMAQKALALRNEIKTYNWKEVGFPENMNVRIALHMGETIEHYKSDNTIDDISGGAVIQAARLEPYVMVGEVFCSQMYADLLAQQKTHNLATINLGKYNLGKAHDKFELDIAVLFAEGDKEMYEEYKSEKCQKHLEEKTKTNVVEQSEVAKGYYQAKGENEKVEANGTKQDIEDFKTLLFQKLEKGYEATTDVFQLIEKCNFQYNKATFTDLKAQSVAPMTQFMPAGFVVALKNFILTIY